MVAEPHAVGLRDLRHHTSEVLARVRHGETIDVTEHGRLIARIVPVGEREPTPILARLEDVPLPIGLSLVNSSFAMPLCEPEAFRTVWERIREALPPGGRFSGQWYGPRDTWLGRPAMTFVSRDEALTLLEGFELEMFEEEEADGTTPRGNAKHWHIFHIVARKPPKGD